MFIFFKDIRLEGSHLQPDGCTTRTTEDTWIGQREIAPRRWADVSTVDIHEALF